MVLLYCCYYLLNLKRQLLDGDLAQSIGSHRPFARDLDRPSGYACDDGLIRSAQAFDLLP